MTTPVTGSKIPAKMRATYINGAQPTYISQRLSTLVASRISWWTCPQSAATEQSGQGVAHKERQEDRLVDMPSVCNDRGNRVICNTVRSQRISWWICSQLMESTRKHRSEGSHKTCEGLTREALKPTWPSTDNGIPRFTPRNRFSTSWMARVACC